MTRLYISGPVTGKPDDNRVAFSHAQRCLVGAGYVAEIPHDYVPSGTPHEDAMALSVNQMTSCKHSFQLGATRKRYDGLALLPGWEQSEGARLEKAVAEACGIPAKTVDEWLEEAR
ncbi:DUF4406 domain-containing protein [Adlercreutzia equolifaciens]|uniref:DUF4406 domain-containing protein n=1 Tax=Adlercreutzia equolifaciens TaxID=446660 RepID=UPI00267415E7|nr:DUF4406 domain-containing protein [Adlercreutzia equolifaciens]